MPRTRSSAIDNPKDTRNGSNLLPGGSTHTKTCKNPYNLKMKKEYLLECAHTLKMYADLEPHDFKKLTKKVLIELLNSHFRELCEISNLLQEGKFPGAVPRTPIHFTPTPAPNTPPPPEHFLEKVGNPETSNNTETNSHKKRRNRCNATRNESSSNASSTNKSSVKCTEKTAQPSSGEPGKKDNKKESRNTTHQATREDRTTKAASTKPKRVRPARAKAKLVTQSSEKPKGRPVKTASRKRKRSVEVAHAREPMDIEEDIEIAMSDTETTEESESESSEEEERAGYKGELQRQKRLYKKEARAIPMTMTSGASKKLLTQIKKNYYQWLTKFVEKQLASFGNFKELKRQFADEIPPSYDLREIHGVCHHIMRFMNINARSRKESVRFLSQNREDKIRKEILRRFLVFQNHVDLYYGVYGSEGVSVADGAKSSSAKSNSAESAGKDHEDAGAKSLESVYRACIEKIKVAKLTKTVEEQMIRGLQFYQRRPRPKTLEAAEHITNAEPADHISKK